MHQLGCQPPLNSKEEEAPRGMRPETKRRFVPVESGSSACVNTRKALRQQFSEKKTLKCSISHMTFARTACMPSLLRRLILLLWTTAYCTRCASVPQTCVQCSLSCGEAAVMKKHKSVIVSIIHPLIEDPDKVYSVSSLCDGERCSVPGCFQRDSLYTLKIYAIGDDTVSKTLVDEPNLQPDCGPNSIPVRNETNSADGKLCNELLIPLAFCFWIVFLLEGPR